MEVFLLLVGILLIVLLYLLNVEQFTINITVPETENKPKITTSGGTTKFSIEPSAAGSRSSGPAPVKLDAHARALARMAAIKEAKEAPARAAAKAAADKEAEAKAAKDAADAKAARDASDAKAAEEARIADRDAAAARALSIQTAAALAELIAGIRADKQAAAQATADAKAAKDAADKAVADKAAAEAKAAADKAAADKAAADKAAEEKAAAEKAAAEAKAAKAKAAAEKAAADKVEANSLATGMFPILRAIRDREGVGRVSKLVSMGADVNVRDEYGTTPLILASDRVEDPEVFKVLLAAGANPNVKDINRWPLLTRVSVNRLPLQQIGILCDAGARLSGDFSVADFGTWTAMYTSKNEAGPIDRDIYNMLNSSRCKD